MKRIAPALGFAVVCVASTHASSARAEGIPAHFVESSKCTSRPCTCDDIPMMDAFLQSQKDAHSAWFDVRGEIFTSGGPQTIEDAVKSFQSKYSGDPRVADQFKMCAGYDPTVNKLSKIAGVSSSGGAMLDPCFCDAFCQDIVDSTVAHEIMHVPTNIAGVVGKAQLFAGCKLGVLPDRLCNALMPLTLVDSELAAHEVGIASLTIDLELLKAEDPAMPEMACTWQPLPAAVTTSLSPRVLEPAKLGVLDRVVLLFKRIVWGEEAVEVASLDVER
jgi:hypothetical protein